MLGEVHGGESQTPALLTVFQDQPRSALCSLGLRHAVCTVAWHGVGPSAPSSTMMDLDLGPYFQPIAGWVRATLHLGCVPRLCLSPQFPLSFFPMKEKVGGLEGKPRSPSESGFFDLCVWESSSGY